MTTSVPSLARRLAAASIAIVALASDARAQHNVAPAGASTVAARPLAFADASRAAARVGDGGGRVLDHAGGGALIGLAAGAVYAFVLTSNSTDDSEDNLAYVVLMPLGTLVGAVVGTFVGLVRTQ